MPLTDEECDLLETASYALSPDAYDFAEPLASHLDNVAARRRERARYADLRARLIHEGVLARD